MEQLTSTRFELPVLYFITNKREIKDLPTGMPFFYGDESIKPYIIRLLEYEVLYKRALATKMPFNFGLLLAEAGFELAYFDHCGSVYMDYVTDDMANVSDDDFDNIPLTDFNAESGMFKEYVKDATAYVDIEKIKALQLFPNWFVTNLEDAIRTNLHNYAIFNPNMYNKKLDGMYGSMDLIPQERNVLNFDISMSIPKAIATSTMLLSKWMAETFFCDIIITGRSTIFIPYEEVHLMDIEVIYEKYGRNQECREFRELITKEVRKYKHMIAFGDDHSICDGWGGTKEISREDGQKLNKWEIETLISFHTTADDRPCGFTDWFSPKETIIVEDWVKYLKT